MKKYFRALYRSFYDATVYREAIAAWPGFGGLYALTLSVVTATLMVVFFAYSAIQFKANVLPHILERVPEITVHNGEVSIKKGSKDPIEIDVPVGKIVIDVKRSAKDFEKDKELVFGLGKDFVMIKTENGLERTPLDPNKNFVIDQTTFKTIFSGYGILMGIFAFPFIILGHTVIFLLQMVGMTVVSYLVTAFIREEYDFETRLRLSALALTPPVLITILLGLTIRHQTGFWFIFLLGALYFYVMIVLNRKTAKTAA